MSDLQVLRMLIFPRAFYKLQNSVKFIIFSVKWDTRVNIYFRKQRLLLVLNLTNER